MVGEEAEALRHTVILALAAHLSFYPHSYGFLGVPDSSVPCSHTVNTAGPASFWDSEMQTLS